MESIKIAFIATVYNEEKSIKEFLHSLFIQSRLPDEIVLVDGGSSDATGIIIEEEFSEFKKYNKKTRVKLFTKKGNRSVGRNFAIENTESKIIACSDAGCILDKNWLQHITSPFSNSSVDVVAGYYKGRYESMFQKCLIPYVLIMPDRIHPGSFLPATRSMAFKKSVWATLGRFPEKFSHNEDYVFARRIKEKKYTISFAKDAVVSWIPPKAVKQAFTMFYRFAYGDAEAGIFRPKVIFLLIRYTLVMILLQFSIQHHSLFILATLFGLFILYGIWAVKKNYRYIGNIKGVIFLPYIQFLADIAVILGTILGIIKKWGIRKMQ